MQRNTTVAGLAVTPPSFAVPNCVAVILLVAETALTTRAVQCSTLKIASATALRVTWAAKAEQASFVAARIWEVFLFCGCLSVNGMWCQHFTSATSHVRKRLIMVLVERALSLCVRTSWNGVTLRAYAQGNTLMW